MSRPTKYIKTDVLNNALGAFWRRGYEGCSVQILVEATGLSRQSLYNIFGDKDGLFRAVIAHYKAILDTHLKPLDAPSASLVDLRTFIEDSLNVQNQAGPGACFLVITAFGEQSADPEINKAIAEGANMVRARIESVISNEIARGVVAEGLKPATGANYLYSMMNGLSALSQTGASTAQISAALDFAFTSIKFSKRTSS